MHAGAPPKAPCLTTRGQRGFTMVLLLAMIVVMGILLTMARPAIRAAVGPSVTVLFDSGIRNGRDVYKALQLGASAVLIGRPAIWGLASAGALGVAHVIRLLRDELEAAMALTGCRTLADAGPELVTAPAYHRE